jgi:hypothetical protein
MMKKVKPHSNTYGRPVSSLDHKEVDFHTLPVSKHTKGKSKFALFQHPFFLEKVGYFIRYKPCD